MDHPALKLLICLAHFILVEIKHRLRDPVEGSIKATRGGAAGRALKSENDPVLRDTMSDRCLIASLSG